MTLEDNHIYVVRENYTYGIHVSRDELKKVILFILFIFFRYLFEQC